MSTAIPLSTSTSAPFSLPPPRRRNVVMYDAGAVVSGLTNARQAKEETHVTTSEPTAVEDGADVAHAAEDDPSNITPGPASPSDVPSTPPAALASDRAAANQGDADAAAHARLTPVLDGLLDTGPYRGAPRMSLRRLRSLAAAAHAQQLSARMSVEPRESQQRIARLRAPAAPLVLGACGGQHTSRPVGPLGTRAPPDRQTGGHGDEDEAETGEETGLDRRARECQGETPGRERRTPQLPRRHPPCLRGELPKWRRLQLPTTRRDCSPREALSGAQQQLWPWRALSPGHVDGDCVRRTPSYLLEPSLVFSFSFCGRLVYDVAYNQRTR
jgi:hypothetical protein